MDAGMMGCLDLWAIVPELILAGLALLLVPVAGLARGRWRGVPTGVAALGLVAACLRSTTATRPKSSLVAPYSCM